MKGSGQLAICAADDDGGDDERQRVGDGEGIKQAVQPEKRGSRRASPTPKTISRSSEIRVEASALPSGQRCYTAPQPEAR